MTSSIRYDESFPLDASEAPPSVEPKKKRTGLIIGIIVGIVILIIIAVVIVVLVLRSRNPPATSQNPASASTLTTCTTDSQCLAPKVCNTSMKRCVDCNTNSQCTGSAFPFCRTETNACVRCLTNSDCNAINSTCSNNICCDSTPPVVNSVTSTISADTRLQINLEIKQPIATSKVFVVLEDPSGFPLISKACTDVKGTGNSIQCKADSDCPPGDACVDQKCEVPGCVSLAAGSFILISSSSIGIPIVAGTPYRVRVKIVYDCGAIKNASTAFSSPFSFVTGGCVTNPIPRTISSIQDAWSIYFYDGVIITFSVPNSSPNFLVGIIGSKTVNFHPNRAEFLLPSVKTRDGPSGLKIILMRTPSRFNSWYYRAFNVGGPGECSGPPGPAVRYDNP